MGSCVCVVSIECFDVVLEYWPCVLELPLLLQVHHTLSYVLKVCVLPVWADPHSLTTLGGSPILESEEKEEKVRIYVAMV